MAGEKGEGKDSEKEEEFIILGKHEPKPSGKKQEDEKSKEKPKTEPGKEKEYTIDFSKTFLIFGKIDKRIIVYTILIIIILLSIQIRLSGVDKYDERAKLASADPWWQYRHANEIYEHGYPGTDIKIIDGEPLYWDYLHDAPEGGPAPVEFYQYFVGYSYKYMGQHFFPDLMSYMRFTPVLFAALAVLIMFFLVKEIFGEKAGLAAAFIFGFSTPYLQRSYVGHADTDAVIIFFVVLTTFLFFKAWNKRSFKWAAISGVSLGFFGFAWPSGYSIIPILLVLAAVICYAVKALEITLAKDGPLSSYFWQYTGILVLMLLGAYISFAILNNMIISFLFIGILLFLSFPVPLYFLYTKDRPLLSKTIKQEWRSLAIIVIFIVIGLLLVTLIIGPWAANIWSSVSGFGTLRASQRAPGMGTEVVRNVFLTVAEFNPASSGIIVLSTHFSIFILAIFSIVLLPFGLFKILKKHIFSVIFLILLAISTFYAALTAVRFIEFFVVPMAIFAAIFVGAGDYLDKKELKLLVTASSIVLAMFVLFLLPNFAMVAGQQQSGPPYYESAQNLGKGAGGGPGANWLNFYSWVKAEIPKDKIFATWWDPGHEFTALAERPTVADGSQNHKHVHDLALMLTNDVTKNLTDTMQLMKKYKISYFYTTTDLISKYGAISFLGTGTGEGYDILNADKNQIAQTADGSLLIPYNYQLSTPQGIVPATIILVLKNNNTDAEAVIRIGEFQTKKIQRLYFPDKDNKREHREYPGNDSADVAFYVFEGYGNAILMPAHIENNLLSQLHIFNGGNLKDYFEPVKTFKSEIKVYRVKYDKVP